MVSFYRRWLAGADRAEALRGAKLELRSGAGTGHPFFWAPFVLIDHAPAAAGAASASSHYQSGQSVL